MVYKILLFVQAPADLRHALSIYEKNEGERIRICVVNVRLIYDFIKTLPLLNVQIDFYPYFHPKFKNIFSIINQRKSFNKIWNEEFNKHEYKEVYFFSRFFDWFTTGIVSRLSKKKNSEVYYYDYSDHIIVRGNSKLKKLSINKLKKCYLSFVVSFISKSSFNDKYTRLPFEFNYKKFEIVRLKIDSNPIVNDRFLYNIGVENRKNAIFFLSPEEFDFITDSSQKKIADIILSFKEKGYYLYLKGHPRLGTPKCVEGMFDQILPSNIPAEFLTYKKLDVVIGIISTALGYPALVYGKETISLIDIVDFVDNTLKDGFKSYLEEISKNRIIFCSEFEELIKLLE